MPTRTLALALGCFRLEPDGRLSRDGVAVHLAPKEAAVLRLLAEAAGRIVTKRQIFEGVWPGRDVSETSLTRCLHELRTALGEHAPRPGAGRHRDLRGTPPVRRAERRGATSAAAPRARARAGAPGGPAPGRAIGSAECKIALAPGSRAAR
jgi:hypothetical protein